MSSALGSRGPQNVTEKRSRQKSPEVSTKSTKRNRSPTPERKSKKERSRSPNEKKSKKSKKSKKHHKRERTVSISSGDSSIDEEYKLSTQLEANRAALRERRERHKLEMKSLETPEEKRARRLAKKLAKEQKQKQELGWGDEYMGYSNIDNPFGDTKLTETFVWSKKLEKQGIKEIDRDDLKAMTRKRITENKKELDYFKKTREEKERAKEDRDFMQREAEAAQFQEWSKQEDKFHLHQAKLRSQIRLKENRAKAIDLLARYVSTEAADEAEEDLDTETVEPYQYLNGLSVRDLEDLLEDIKVYRALDGKADTDIDEYWRDISVIAEEELNKLRRAIEPVSAAEADRRDGIHGAVKQDVQKIFHGKSHKELALLEAQIMTRIKSNAQGVDVGYWESLLGTLKAHMARARLYDRHQDVVKQKLARMKCAQMKTEIKKEDTDEVMNEPSTSEMTSSKLDDADREEEVFVPWSKLTTEERVERTCDDYVRCGYSPMYKNEDELGPNCEIIDEKDDIRTQKFDRRTQKQSGQATSQNDANLEAEARKGMTGDEASFAVEEPIEQVAFLWSDKYKPRKPRYFNRVHTGFQWNKYNQTHYDLDNPPPKIVQGYRFNVFYPDLLDPSMTPQFKLYPCTDPDFAIIRFTAGPPYEDIAFKIVHREWDILYKRGYRCQFQNGIFQLWFHFKRWSYRR